VSNVHMSIAVLMAVNSWQHYTANREVIFDPLPIRNASSGKKNKSNREVIFDPLLRISPKLLCINKINTMFE
jgi:hypothetical protein